MSNDLKQLLRSLLERVEFNKGGTMTANKVEKTEGKYGKNGRRFQYSYNGHYFCTCEEFKSRSKKVDAPQMWKVEWNSIIQGMLSIDPNKRLYLIEEVDELATKVPEAFDAFDKRVIETVEYLNSNIEKPSGYSFVRRYHGSYCNIYLQCEQDLLLTWVICNYNHLTSRESVEHQARAGIRNMAANKKEAVLMHLSDANKMIEEVRALDPQYVPPTQQEIEEYSARSIFGGKCVTNLQTNTNEESHEQ